MAKTLEDTAAIVRDRTLEELQLRPKMHGSLCFNFRDGQLMNRNIHHFDEQLAITVTEREYRKHG